MSTAYYTRMMATIDERFRKLLRLWLASLPKSGWRGTAAELYPLLEAVNEGHKCYTCVNSSQELSKSLAMHDPFIRTLGWRVEFRRSNGKRLIVFSRINKHRSRRG